MNVLSFVPPFTEGKIYNKRNLKCYFKKAGVYIIKENGIVVYVGMSKSCVVEAMYRHFYRWKDWREERVTYYASLGLFQYECAILVFNSDTVEQVERALIFSMKPRDNKNLYEEYFVEKIENKIEQENEQQTDGDDERDLPF